MNIDFNDSLGGRTNDMIMTVVVVLGNGCPNGHLMLHMMRIGKGTEGHGHFYA